ncbi:MAG TPA: alpha-2-macroglobulin family protein, partial [Bacteroidales bacterium]|nr:alpha-2-macroglobulin family protein [Bacteroidales bacterium]
AESTVFEKTLDSAKDSMLSLKDLPGLTQGSYRLILKSVDPFGKQVEMIDHFTAFDPQSKEMPVNELGWFVLLTPIAEPGQKAQFLLGSKEEDVHVIYEVYVHDTLYSRQMMKLNDQQKLIEIPVVEGFRGNFAVNFAFVKHNRPFRYSSIINIPYTNKKLDITFETFRNKLVPGQQEEWRIRITNAAKRGAEAEFLATMYDASLDVFSVNTWSSPVTWPWYGFQNGTFNDGFRTSDGIFFSAPFGEPTESRFYETLNWFGFAFSGGRNNRFMKSGRQDDDVLLYSLVEKSTAAPGVAETSEDKENIPPSVSPEIKKVTTPVRVRKDFRETAFFYPALITDKEGALILKFTVPESLTQWKMMGLAHTKEVETGLIIKELVTQKDLMVFPNAPRFVRQGDTLVFSTKVVNLSNRALNGEVTLELSNGISSEPVKLILVKTDLLDKNTESFTLPLGQSAAFTWKLAIPVDASLSLLQYRVTARSGNFSDGEEKAIPVLTNRMLVTESLPMPVRGSGKFDFNLEKLTASQPGHSLKNYRLTLE